MAALAALLSFFSEQVVDGHAEGVGEVLELVVCDHSVARLDPADGLLRDVKPRDLDLIREALLREVGPLSGFADALA